MSANSPARDLITDTNRDEVCRTHTNSWGLNQKGGVKCIELWRRMLRSFDHAGRQRGHSGYRKRYERFNKHNGRRMKRDVPSGKHVGALLGNHPFATIVALIGPRVFRIRRSPFKKKVYEPGDCSVRAH